MFNSQKYDQLLLYAILFAAIAGVICGWFFGEAMKSVSWLGKLFLDALKMTIIPLIVAAVISGVSSLGDIRNLGKLGGLTVLYYAVTTALAVLTGLILVNIIQPGAGDSPVSSYQAENITATEPAGFVDIIHTLISPNLLAAAVDTQLLPIIIFCLIFGAALSTTGKSGEPVIGFFNGMNEVMMKIVNWIMIFAPIGIFAMIASRLGEAGGGEAFFQEIKQVGLYIVTVAAGLLIHFCVLLGLLLFFTGNAMAYLTCMMRALLTAFGTASSSATLPLTMECALEGGVDKRAVKFVLPLGATVNMDGTALYEAVAVMFIAQAYAISMGFGQQMIGAAGIPQAGLVTMIIVLTAVNLPLEGIGMLLAVDWFLDRLRTTVNVWGDSAGAAILGNTLYPVQQTRTQQAT